MTTDERHQIQTALCRLAEATDNLRQATGQDHYNEHRAVLDLDTITSRTLRILDITLQGGAE